MRGKDRLESNGIEKVILVGSGRLYVARRRQEVPRQLTRNEQEMGQIETPHEGVGLADGLAYQRGLACILV